MNRAYFMEHPREAERLARKADVPAWLARFFPPGWPAPGTILDVGCGPAAFVAELAHRFPGSQVVGLDRSPERLAEAAANLTGLGNARVQAGEANSLPFGDGQFDFVMCRFLLEYLPDPAGAIREMARVCRPGGTVLLQDLDGQLVWHHPEDPELRRDLHLVLKHLAFGGFDPFIGRKLHSLALAAGLGDLQVSAEAYHLIAGRIDAHNRALWELKLTIALPAAVAALGSGAAAEDLKRRFLAFLDREDTLSYSTLFTVRGRKLT